MSTPDQLLIVLEETASLIKKTQVNLKKCPKPRLTRGYLETRIQCIEEYWQSFKSTHQDLVKCTPREKRGEIPYFLNEDYFRIEDLYLCLQGDLKDAISNATTTTTETSHDTSMSDGTHPQVRLPPISLPIFTGNYEEWPTFNDLFLSLVHKNASLSNVQKLHYLKSSIAGEPAALLKHVMITEQNYEKACSTLKQRYGNKRIIVNNLFKRLFGQKKNSAQTANQIKGLLDTTTECLNNLQNLNISIDSWDPFIIYLVVQRLDPDTHKSWEEQVYNSDSEELPKWEELRKFLEAKYRTFELVNPATATTSRDRTIKERSFHSSTPAKICFLCKEDHNLYHCKEFIEMSAGERMEYVQRSNLCFNCLLAGHSVVRCRLPFTCRLCRRRHHTLIHQEQNTESEGIQVQHSQMTQQRNSAQEHDNEGDKVDISSNFACKNNMALLATAIVHVEDEAGHTTALRALIDQGSQSSFISDRAAQALRVKRHAAKGTVTGVGSSKTNIESMTYLQISSRCTEEVKLNVTAYILKSRLTSQLPSRKINYDNSTWPHLQGLTLADPTFNKPGRIDMLLGVEVCAQIFNSAIIRGPPGTPCAQDTKLGWILFGNAAAVPQAAHAEFLVMHHQVDVDDMLRTLWEVDTMDTKRILTKEEEQCETIYKETHDRNDEGRYIVKLPFKTSQPQSPEGNTREIAVLRLKQLEKRFEKNAELRDDYIQAMEDLIEQNYMEEIPEEELQKTAVYLPHHAVIKKEKETTKIRIVFNASSKGSNGVSLNDELLVGPHLQEDLRNIVIRWRLRRIAMIADIKKMYLQILVNEADTDFQRVLWRKRATDPIKDYRLLRVTFGTAAAPYLAVRTLQQVAEDEGQDCPIASQIIRDDYFMDDLMTGRDTVTEAVDTAKQIVEILKKGGFPLQKWASNSTEFLQEFEPAERSSCVRIDIELGGTIKALGLCWNMGEDTFQYTWNLPKVPEVITKRGILAEIQRLFDPLGWLAPALLPVKIIIQNLWITKITWDEEVTATTREEWLGIRRSLDHLKDIKVDRWVQTTSDSIREVTIHGFCDASTHAYGAVVYLRVRTIHDEYKTFLLAAKTRVSPLKPMSVPRLELCGAVLLSKLMQQISEAIRIPISQMYAWTDSMIVLAWLHGDPARWQTFVRNRVVTIMDNIGGDQWHHVDSKDNPADFASRGMLLGELKTCKTWWEGPEWLRNNELKIEKPKIEDTNLELRKNVITSMNLKLSERGNMNKGLLEKCEEYDSLPELLKSIAKCKRFLLYLKTKNDNMERIISTEEMDKALQIVVQAVQGDSFREEIESLKTKGTVGNKSRIKTLNPYLDENNILRVGGRLRHAAIGFERKHPIILDKGHFSTLIITDAHRRTLHGRLQLTLNYIRSRYWIIRDKSMAKTYLRKCWICARQNATSKIQLMGDLPKERVTPARPFLNSGVDFAGPYQILMSKGRGARTCKAYIAIFVCMVTKAVHLELVSDLTTEAFLGAFKRFVGRRGRCNHIWSDQGRNFIGASKELTDCWREAKLELEGEVSEKLALDGTQWHYIPAYSPNFGGLWEAGVRSMKYHLKRILNTHLTFEEMTTVLCQVEACLNSRPLCPVDERDVDSLEVLTPGHFLIGEALITVPSPSLRDARSSHLSRWQHTQKVLQDFWRQWQQEYLSRLQQRPKWLKRKEELDVGQIVLVKSDNLPPGKWQLGRIVQKHPGLDNITRVYSVKSGDSIVKRPITKLCLMPVDIES